MGIDCGETLAYMLEKREIRIFCSIVYKSEKMETTFTCLPVDNLINKMGYIHAQAGIL